MTIGTPDVVTAITMVRNGELDKFIAFSEEEIIKDSYGKPIRVKRLDKRSMWIVSRTMMSLLGLDQRELGKPS